MGNLKAAEDYALLLVGSGEKAVPSITHLQKEMFILSRINKKILDHLTFEKHYYGPFSQTLSDIVENSLFRKDAFFFDEKRICLSDTGKKGLQQILSKNKSLSKFKMFLISIKLVRELYDRLNQNELLFLIYVTFPEYTEHSRIWERLVKNTDNRKRILKGLVSKGAITEERFAEITEELDERFGS
jgi:hypothetical protein